MWVTRNAVAIGTQLQGEKSRSGIKSPSSGMRMMGMVVSMAISFLIALTQLSSHELARKRGMRVA